METNNYPNWLVNVGQAKRLKKIGFDLPCQFFLPIKMYEDFDTRELGFDFEKENYNKDEFYWSIPSYEQVFEWFRGKGFIGVIDCYFDEEKNRPFYKGSVKNFLGELIFEATEIGEYKEARECLVYQLIDEWKKMYEKTLNKEDWATLMSGILSM